MDKGPGVGRAIAFGLLLIQSAGCYTQTGGGTHALLPRIPPPHQAYAGPARPASEVAVVETSVGHSRREDGVFILTVDDQRIPGLLDGIVEAHVLPGMHTFGLTFGSNAVILGAKDTPLVAAITFDAEAGHTYRIHGRQQRMKGASRPARVSAYVVDVASGARVASEMHRDPAAPPPSTVAPEPAPD